MKKFISVDEVVADRSTGDWLCVPVYTGDIIERVAWDSMPDSEDVHFDTYESNGETRGIKVIWQQPATLQSP